MVNFIFLLLLTILIPVKAKAQSIAFTGTQISPSSSTSSFSYNGSYYTVTGSGSNVGSVADSTYFVNTQASGNIEITANLSNVPAGSPTFAQAGLMIRQTQGSSIDNNSPNAFVYITPGNGINFSYRTTTGGQTTNVLGPSITGSMYLKLAINNQNVTAYYSSNGSSWTSLGSCSLNLTSNYYTGFCVNSSNTTSTMATQFNNFNLSINVPQITPNLAFWLRSDFGVTTQNGNLVTNMQDLSINHFNFAQSNTSYAPSLVANAQNNLPAISFNYQNIQNLQSVPNVIPTDFSSGVSVFMVANPNAALNPQGQFMLDLGNYLNNDIALAFPYTGTGKSYLNFHVYNGTTDNSIASPNSVALGSFQLFEATQAGGIGNIFLNGTLSANAALNNPLPNITRNNNALGGLPNGASVGQYYFNGQIAEVLVYQGELNQTDRQNIENYLLFKYNLNPYPTPVISLVTGVYPSAQTITITAPNNIPQMPIYYTTDGTVPTTSSNLYTGAFTVNATTQVNAAVISPYGQSPVASNYFKIDAMATTTNSLNPQLWLMADCGVSQSSGKINGWQNLATGNAATPNFNFYQANSSYMPSYNSSDINNLPSVGFNGSQILTAGIDNLANYSNGVSIFAVTKTTTLTNLDARLMDFGNAYNNDIAFGLSYTSGNNFPTMQVYQNTSDSILTGSNSVVANGSYMLGGVQAGSNNTGIIYFNSSESATNPLSNALSGITRGSNAIGGVETGTGYGGNNYTGNISELLVFPQPLTSVQVQAVEIYLANKYNLTGPSLPDPTISVATGVYTNNQTVTLSTPIPGLNIYYTTDGAVPIVNNPDTYLYTGPLTISSSTLLRARAIVNPNYFSSGISDSYICVDAETQNIQQANLQLWLRSDFGVSQSSSYVRGWQDLSGNNFSFSQSDNNLPVLTANAINGQSAIYFNGSQILDGPTTSTNYSSGLSIFAVVKPIGLSIADIRMLDFGNVNNNDIALGLIYTGSSSIPFNPAFHIYNGSTNNYIQSGNNITSGTNYLYEVFQNGSSIGNIYLNAQDQIQAALNNAVTTSRYNNGIGGLNTADGGDGTNNFNGYIAEILVYNTELGATQRQAVESYLSKKYDIGPGPGLNAPNIATATGVYSGNQSVTITQTGNPIGTNIYYTTDGTTPTTSSPLYTEPINITRPTTLKAIAGQDYGISPVATNFIDIDANTINIPRSNLQGWYMANLGVTQVGSNTVNGWYDLSGNNFNFNQNTSYLPTFANNIFNGYPALVFNGSEVLGAAPTSVNYTGGVSVFVVAQPTGQPATDMRMFNLGNYTTDNIATGLFNYSNNNYASFQISNASGTDQLILGGATNLESQYLFESLQSGASSQGYVFYNGNIPGAQSLNPPSSPTVGYRANNGIGGIYLGNGSPGTTNFQGNIAEILVYNNELSTAQIRAVEAYLCNKYAITNSNITFNAPTLSVNTGVYPSSQIVTISQSGNAAGTQIHYTLDGSTPTNASPIYTTPITVNSSTVIQAIASMNFGQSGITTSYICIDPSTNGLPLANLNLWLRGDFGVTQSSGAVSGWQDLSGNNFNFNQFTPSYKPTYIANDINNQPAISFNNSQILLGGINANDYTNGVSIFVVTKASNPSSSDARILDFGNDLSNDIAFGTDFTSSYFPAFHIYNGTSNVTMLGGNPLQSGAVYVLDAIQTGSSNVGNIYYNGSLSKTQGFSAAVSGSRGSNAIGGVNTGTGFGTYNYKGDIGEILVYNTALNDNQRVAVESYLSNKYGQSEGPAISPPTISPGNTVSPLPVTLAITKPNPPVGNIYYTTDGSTPTSGSNLYIAPFTINTSSSVVASVITSYGQSSNTTSSTSLIQIDPLSGYVPRGNLALWLKSDYGLGTTSLGSTNVNSWADMSGNGFNFTQSTSSFYPTLISNAINNKPAVNFNGNNQSLEAYPITTDFGNGVSSFVVAQPALNGTTTQSFFDFGNYNNNDISLGLLNSGGFKPAFHIFQGSSDNPVIGANVINANQSQLFEAVQGSNIANVFLNSLIQGNGPLTNSPASLLRNSNSIGGLANGSNLGLNYFSGQIAEILVYNATLNPQQQGAVESYLMNKYQLYTLTPNAPIFSVSATPNTNPPSTNLNAVTTVTIASDPNTTIYYTVDGSTPTTASPQYVSPITINTTTKINAIAVNNSQTSPVSSIQYILDATKFPPPQANYTTPIININKPTTSTP